jgi:hypothetical protein
MNHNLPALGIRFDINKTDSADYGGKSWKMFWRVIDIQKLCGTVLFEGDTSATASGKENVYCIAIQSSNDAIFDDIQSAFEQSTDFQKLAASPKFVRGKDVAYEPLIETGHVDASGELIGGINSKPALKTVREERERAKSKEAPERIRPASARTQSLPTLNSINELREFMKTVFIPQDTEIVSEFWITPEELCDIFEHYTAFIEVQFVEGISTSLSEDLCFVRIYQKGEKDKMNLMKFKLADDEGIALTGLFSFRSEAAASEFVSKHAPTPKYAQALPKLAGIQGKYQLNFGKASQPFEFNRYCTIPPEKAWGTIWVRQQRLVESLRREQDTARERAAAEERRQAEETQRKAKEAKENEEKKTEEVYRSLTC